jgi:addiction module HigA family antidote
MPDNRKRRPTHPGAVLREDVLPELGLSQGEFAARLGLSRRTVNEVLLEKRPVSVDMAHRLARALDFAGGLAAASAGGGHLGGAARARRGVPADRAAFGSAFDIVTI